MYRAKWDGKNRYVVFETGCRTRSRTAWNWRWTCATRSKNDEFFLAYQPTFDLSDMSPTGVEALIRWQPPHARRRPARRLHPSAGGDRHDPRGRQVGPGAGLQPGCRVARRPGTPIGMAVNVSARQLDTDQLIADIEDALADSGLDPEALTIEITETTLMRNVEETARSTGRDQAARRTNRDRRLRHRLLIARPPATLPRRRAEDRPLVHLRAQHRTRRARRSSTPSCSSARPSRSRPSPRASSSSRSSPYSKTSTATAVRASSSPGPSTWPPPRRSCGKTGPRKPLPLWRKPHSAPRASSRRPGALTVHVCARQHSQATWSRATSSLAARHGPERPSGQAPGPSRRRGS